MRDYKNVYSGGDAVSGVLPLERQWAKLLQEFMAAYEIAAESAMGVPPEVYEIAPLAAAFLHKRGLANSKVAQALLQRDARAALRTHRKTPPLGMTGDGAS